MLVLGMRLLVNLTGFSRALPGPFALLCYPFLFGFGGSGGNGGGGGNGGTGITIFLGGGGGAGGGGGVVTSTSVLRVSFVSPLCLTSLSLQAMATKTTASESVPMIFFIKVNLSLPYV